MQIFRYKPGLEAEARIPKSGNSVLGRLGDGEFEVEVVKLSKNGPCYDVLLKHGQALHSETISSTIYKWLKDGTGFDYPQGGIAAVSIRDGRIVDVFSREEN
jgi:hypothetical protein